jgi:hypothetical protein
MQGQNQQSQTERNKEIVRRFVEEVQNNRDWAVYEELNAPDFVNLSAPPGVPSDREGGKVFLGSFMDAFFRQPVDHRRHGRRRRPGGDKENLYRYAHR